MSPSSINEVFFDVAVILFGYMSHQGAQKHSSRCAPVERGPSSFFPEAEYKQDPAAEVEVVCKLVILESIYLIYTVYFILKCSGSCWDPNFIGCDVMTPPFGFCTCQGIFVLCVAGDC